jgi:hypothetical protein
MTGTLEPHAFNAKGYHGRKGPAGARSAAAAHWVVNPTVCPRNVLYGEAAGRFVGVSRPRSLQAPA